MDSIKKYFSQKDFDRLIRAKEYFGRVWLCFDGMPDNYFDKGCINLDDFLDIFNLYYKKHGTGLDVTNANSWLRDIRFEDIYTIWHIADIKEIKIKEEHELSGPDHAEFFADGDNLGPSAVFVCEAICYLPT